MPKVSLSLQAAKAKDADILAKLSKVKQASQSHKQQTKLNQQRLEWTEQARKLKIDERRLDNDLEEIANSLGLLPDFAEERHHGQEAVADMWFQVAGVRQLVAQVKLRDAERLRRAPDQALSLKEVLDSVSAALHSLGIGLTSQAGALEQECSSARRLVRAEALEPVTFSRASGIGDRHSAENCCDLSDEEDALLERLDDDEGAFCDELQSLNDQVRAELAALEKELAEHRKRRSGWDEDANFRFVCIKRQFQGRSRDLMLDRMSLEFPHLSREQLQVHETHLDALKFTAQKQASAFRQWRRERFQLLRRHQSRLEDRQRQQEEMKVRKQEMQEQREKQRQLHGKLQSERARFSAKQEERQRADSQQRRLRESEDREKELVTKKRAQAVKEAAKEHLERKREQQAQKEEESAEQERLEAEERQRRLQRNAEVVRMRREMDALKQKEAVQQRQAAEQEQREREHRLQQALERLRPEAARDPERLHWVPERAKAQAYADPMVCVTRGPQAGFDENRLMADARYKISSALQAAGLYGTKAAHEVLASVAAPRPAQPHTVSQVFSGGYPGGR